MNNESPQPTTTDGGTLVRDVMDEAARARLVSNVAAHLRDGVSDKVLQRAFQYWKNVDKEIGEQIEDSVRMSRATESPNADRSVVLEFTPQQVIS